MIDMFVMLFKVCFLCTINKLYGNKKELESKKELARLYFFIQGETQKSIAAKIGVSETTVGKWCDKDGWKEKKAAMNVTRPEIVNKNLVLISRLLDKLNSEDIQLSDIGKIVDQISKLAAASNASTKKPT
jgi:Putative ATPase subunit of terminase (gpP-like).